MAGTNPPGGRSSSGIPGSGTVLATNRLVLLAAVPRFLVLASVAYLTFQFAANEREAQGWVRHTYQVIEAQYRIENDIQSAETGQRGYLLTHQPIFLQNYHRYATQAPGDIQKFRDQARADRLQKAVQIRLDTLAHNVDLVKTLGTTPPPELGDALLAGRQQMAN